MRIINISIRDVQAHETCTVTMPSNLYGCVLGENVFVGPFCELQSTVSIGKRTRIQSHSFICEGTQIGEDCFIGHGVIFINDLFQGDERAHGDKSKYKYAKIEDNVLIGSGAIIHPVLISSGSIIGSGSVVLKDINEPGVYAGVPARLIRPLS